MHTDAPQRHSQEIFTEIYANEWESWEKKHRKQKWRIWRWTTILGSFDHLEQTCIAWQVNLIFHVLLQCLQLSWTRRFVMNRVIRDRDRNMPQKILWPSHNALFPIWYFAQVAMWVVSDKRQATTSDNITEVVPI